MLRIPRGERRLGYEFRVREEALKLVRLKGFLIQEAIWVSVPRPIRQK